MSMNALNWVIQLPDLVLDLIFVHYDFKRFKEYVKTPFVCPNCGKNFFAKWYHLLWNRDVSLVMVKKAKLKCPHCKIKDMCRWTESDNV